MTAAEAGRLVVVGTPIGNLEDITVRAVKALSEADVVYCEDTRRTRGLLSAMDIPAPPLVRLDQHNEESMAAPVVQRVADGAYAVLVTDAGMPTISDPGYRVVQAVSAAGYLVEVVPGPTAVSAALALSGLPASEYRFAGFLPRKGRDRTVALETVRTERATTVIYEAPYRVARTVTDLARTCGGDRRIAAAREITKLHEEVWRGTLDQAVDWLEQADSPPRGEWVLVVGGTGRRRSEVEAGAEPDRSDATIVEALRQRLSVGDDRKEAVAGVAADMDIPKRPRLRAGPYVEANSE